MSLAIKIRIDQNQGIDARPLQGDVLSSCFRIIPTHLKYKKHKKVRYYRCTGKLNENLSCFGFPRQQELVGIVIDEVAAACLDPLEELRQQRFELSCASSQ